MNKHIMIMRHGKSDWNNAEDDFDRPLSARGCKNVVTIAQRLLSLEIIPDIILSSASKRTQQTTELILETIQRPKTNVSLLDSLYLADMYTLLDVIEQTMEKDITNLLLIAHNPGLDNLVSYLSTEPPPRNMTGKLMTTAATAIFEYDGDSMKGRQMPLKYLLRPKELD